MSAPSESAASPAPCACTNISLMQLFHELKQKFPGVPDHVVSNTIELYCHDKQACEKHLHTEVKASLTHAYHASSSAAARHLNRLKLQPPLKCRNQPIVKHEINKPTVVTSTLCDGPQQAILSSHVDKAETLNTDANQNIVETKNEELLKDIDNSTTPVTIINIDNCHVKYNADSPSDSELTNENVKEEPSNNKQQVVQEQPESTNYKILKSNKIKSNLNEKLEKGKEKPKRPNTLDFIRPNPNPEIAFKQAPKNIETTSPCRTVSPAQPPPLTATDEGKETAKGGYRPDRGGYPPLNLSVNVNCHMDLSRGYEPWLEEYDSGRAITSVNLTVCTPTSSMASPEREGEGFEGHVTVTVSPSSARPPRRRAPPPPPPAAHPTPPATHPSPPSTHTNTRPTPSPARPAPEPPTSTIDRSLIERQKERLNRLAMALAQEKGRLVQLSKETHILGGAPPSPPEAQRLRDYVGRLRDTCDTLAKRLEMSTNETDESSNFYSNIYTGQRPSSSWQCHMCTFRNHPLLDKCEECDMPRILVGTSLSPSSRDTRGHDSGFGSFRDRDRVGLTERMSRALTDTHT